MKPLSPEEEKALAGQLRPCYRKPLPEGDFIAIVAKGGAHVMAAAFLIMEERPAGAIFGTGMLATVINVITYPQYRKKAARPG